MVAAGLIALVNSCGGDNGICDNGDVIAWSGGGSSGGRSIRFHIA